MDRVLLLAHGDDLIEANLQRAAVRLEADEFRAVRGVDIRNDTLLSLRNSFQLELQLDGLPVHGRRFELVVIVAGDWLVLGLAHAVLPYTFNARGGSIDASTS